MKAAPYLLSLPALLLFGVVVIVPLGILLAVRLVPPALMAEMRERATALGRMQPSCAGAAAIIALWLAGLALVALWLLR